MGLGSYWEEDCPYNAALEKLGVENEAGRALVTVAFAAGVIIGSAAVAGWHALWLAPTIGVIVGAALKVYLR